MGVLANSNAIESGGYTIDNSLRFQSASSQYLSRTPSTSTNRKTWSQSFWTKYSATADGSLVGIVQNSSQTQYRVFFENRNLRVFSFESGFQFQFITTQVFRDPSAWYHILIVLDTTQATSTNRFKLYVNGVQVTAFSTASYPSLNADCNWNRNLLSQIGASGATDSFYDGYMTEVNFIDGQALTPSDFGETNTDTGQWIAKKYTGTYGTNGFYLPFSDGTSTTTLGYDASGNGNNWTLNNFTRSAGVSDCWMFDVPSGNSSTGGNYAVLNPLGKAPSISLTSGNLSFTNTTFNTYPAVGSTIFVSTGKWYFEGVFTGGGTAEATIGLSTINNFASLTFQTATSGTTFWNNAQGIFKNGTVISATPTFTYNDIIGVAYDADAGTVTYYKNGVAQTPVVTGITGSYSPTFGIQYYNAGQWNANFGQRSFAYTPPTGFKALCTANLPAATIKQGNQYMDATTYTGNATARSITNAGSFQPDLVWIKNRSVAYGNILVDSVRGVNNWISSDSTATEAASPTNVTAFNSNGFSIDTWAPVNGNTNPLVAWQWDAGSSTVTNTDGSISSQVRANPTAGVSVVTYTGIGANATVGHGLGVAPKMIIVRLRSGVQNWGVYHASIGNTKSLFLNLTNAADTNIGYWNNTSPTSSVFSIGSGGTPNTNLGTHVAYCFSEIAGYSKFGSYTGNGSADGTFVYTGFRPKFVMVKRTDNATGAYWVMTDTTRSPYNINNLLLLADQAGSEVTTDVQDILSNGFKLRSTDVSRNASGGNYIYMAFAENPFANSNAR